MLHRHSNNKTTNAWSVRLYGGFARHTELTFTIISLEAGVTKILNNLQIIGYSDTTAVGAMAQIFEVQHLNPLI